MAQFDGFLIRSSLSDTGNIPRSGSWTQSPDIIPAGTVGINPQELVANYGKLYNNTLAQGQSNFIYVRSKNLSASQLTKRAYLFQAPQSLFLFPSSWYSKNNLIHFTNSENVEQEYQEITAAPNQIVATNAYEWVPQSTEHHCLVTVVADDWDAVQASFPPNVTNSTQAFGAWIYANGNIGWHNVNIAAMQSQVIEGATNFGPMPSDATVTFTLTAENVPVGAECTFTSTSTKVSNQYVSQGWTPVPTSQSSTDPTINPVFQVGTRVDLKAGDYARIVYRTNFKGHAKPTGFKQSMSAALPVSQAAMHTPQFMAKIEDPRGLYLASINSAFTEEALFTCPDSGKLIAGQRGLENMYRDVITTRDTQPFDFFSVIGSDTTVPADS